MLKGLPLTRRQLLASMAATGLTVGLYPKMALSADGKILRVRAYTDIQNIDPAFRTGSPEDDVMKCILPGLVSVKAGDEWGWQLDCAEKINQVDPTHVEFTLQRRSHVERRLRPCHRRRREIFL